jgi:S-methylmethionine-dependent homocysteine/selenocysteine methylase
MHRKYIDCGVDIITTNTYSSARHNLEPLGLGDSTVELNLRGVNLAMEARDRYANKQIWIAGSVSNFGLTAGGEEVRALHRHAQERSEISERQSIANLEEQAGILEDAGVDFLLAESTGSMTHRMWVLNACQTTALPVWLGFRARWNDQTQILETGYSSDLTFEQGVQKVVAGKAPEGIAIFHSTVDSTNRALPILRKHWSGPIAIYPEADRSDYTATWRDEAVASDISPSEFANQANAWREDGVNVIGGCCGIDVNYIQAFTAAS